jgi:BirA family biotin operon repressor/biotin-[acetyl-CoA-carboxylase] ligase
MRDEHVLMPHLRGEMAGKLHIFNAVESTNATAKKMAAGGCPHGTVVIADAQTAGRGRRGKSFYSPPGSGLYMSFVLAVCTIGPAALTTMTAAAAVAVCRAIALVSGIEPSIKWVNDVLISGKKVCGILAEAVSDAATGEVSHIVLGVGVNVNTGAFPDDIKRTAGSIFSGSADEEKARLAAELINAIALSDSWIRCANFHEEYRRRCSTLERDITVTLPAESFIARALDLDDDFRLIIKKSDGEILTLSSGEVSVRM